MSAASEPDASASPASESDAGEPPGTVLTLAEAARTVGLSERALRKHVDRGKLPARRILRNGRAVAAVELAALRRIYGSLVMVPTGEAAAGRARLRSTREIAQTKRLRALRAENDELGARLARLRALLGMERTQTRELQRQLRFTAQALARCEERLDAAREEIRELSLELGKCQGRVEVLQEARGRAEAAPPAGG